ncbi:MAG: hypothetical protein ACXWCZ_03465 [Flavisolibacter sp.]
MKKLLIGFTFLSIFIGCNNTGTQTESQLSVDTTTAKAYFPVLDFIKSEIRYVDSLPVGIMKYTTENGKTDSGYIKQPEFHQLAQEFISPALEKESFEKEFSETSFFDNTTQYSNFLYSTANRNITLHRVDVLSKPVDEVYNKVRSIYMEKSFQREDSSFIQKMYWKAGQNFLINTEITTSKPDVITRQVKVVWNPWE